MKLVETLVVRDEVDIVEAQIAYHLNAGVDFVIATDHESCDGTTEILEAYARQGHLRRIAVSGPVREDVWRTRMARLAATEHGADWVINTDADQFYWPRRGTLKEIFSAVPDRFGVIGCMNRHFVPVPHDGSPFFERMTLRVSPPVALNDPTSPWRPGATVAHRAEPRVRVFHAGYAVAGEELFPVPGWYPIDILHFPYRSVEQWLRKTTRRAHGDKPLGIYVKGDVAREQGRVEDVYASVDVDDRTVTRGSEAGSLISDNRLRDRLRGLVAGSPKSELAFRIPIRVDLARDTRAVPDLHDSAVTDLTALHDATLVRLQRRIDDVAHRAAALEQRARRLSRS
jgi:hypothetical protein